MDRDLVVFEQVLHDVKLFGFNVGKTVGSQIIRNVRVGRVCDGVKHVVHQTRNDRFKIQVALVEEISVIACRELGKNFFSRLPRNSGERGFARFGHVEVALRGSVKITRENVPQGGVARNRVEDVCDLDLVLQSFLVCGNERTEIVNVLFHDGGKSDNGGGADNVENAIAARDRFTGVIHFINDRENIKQIFHRDKTRGGNALVAEHSPKDLVELKPRDISFFDFVRIQFDCQRGFPCRGVFDRLKLDPGSIDGVIRERRDGCHGKNHNHDKQSGNHPFEVFHVQ